MIQPICSVNPYTPPVQNYNGVKIDIQNATVKINTCNDHSSAKTGASYPQQPVRTAIPQGRPPYVTEIPQPVPINIYDAGYAPQYATVTAPQYSYPEARLYDYPQAVATPAQNIYNQNPNTQYNPQAAYAQNVYPAQAVTTQQAVQYLYPQAQTAPTQQVASSTAAPQAPYYCPPCPVCADKAAKGTNVPAAVVTPVQAINDQKNIAITQPVQPVEAARTAPASVAAAVSNSNVTAPITPPAAQPVVLQQNYNVATPAPMIATPQAAPQAAPIAVAKAPEAAPVVAQAVVVAEPVQTKKVEVIAPQPLKPNVDLSAFLARLADVNADIQAGAMEEIANMVKEKPDMATELLDEKIINALINVIKADTNNLGGPTAAQMSLREKLMTGKKLTPAEQEAAMTLTPMEQAERNKVYATFTTAILQKLYADEVNKLTNTMVPLTELPGAVAIVENLKNNPNPMVRTSAIEALSYIQNPAYKQDLTALFTVAQNDKEPAVKEAAKAGLARLSQV